MPWAWGSAGDGELGFPAPQAHGCLYPCAATAKQITPLSGYVAVSGGGYHTIALRSDKTVWTWGYNADGELGNGTFSVPPDFGPRQVTGLADVIAIAAGAKHNLALKSDGTVWAWGTAFGNVLGAPTSEVCFEGSACSTTPLQVRGPGGGGFLTGIVAIAAGASHSVALGGDGTVWTWGSNFSGQLGTGGFDESQFPVVVRGPGGGPLSGVAAIASSSFAYHTLAIWNDGSLWGWGSNDHGQLALPCGFPCPVPLPIQIPGLSGVRSMAAGAEHSLAVKDDGTAWGWGRNTGGELGLGFFSTGFCCIFEPTMTVNFSGGVAVAAGFGHSLALKGDGTVWSWGNNSIGQLGTGIQAVPYASATPSRVVGLYGVSAIGAGQVHSLAIARRGLGPIVAIEPKDVRFFNQAPGTTSDPQTITVRNLGTSNLVIQNVALRKNGGAGTGDFTFTGGPFPLVVPPGGATGMTVRFTARVAGVATSANLFLIDNAFQSPGTVYLAGYARQDSDMSIGVSAPAEAEPGGELTYTIEVRNLGPDLATDAEVVNTLPEGVTFIRVEVINADCYPSGQIVNCQLYYPPPPGGGAFVIKIVARVTAPAGASLTDTASVSIANNDPHPANNTAEVTTVVK